MHVRVNLDVDISYEEATFIKETFVNTYKLREITLIPQKITDENVEYDTQGNIMFESIDTIVTNQLTNINSDQYDPKLLMDIYRNL
jgi:methylaspartate ammonia-lyase